MAFFFNLFCNMCSWKGSGLTGGYRKSEKEKKKNAGNALCFRATNGRAINQLASKI